MDLLEAMKSSLLLPGSNLLFRLSESMPNASCGSSSDDQECRDDSAALRLKVVAIAAILVSSLAGIALPLVGKDRRFLRTDSNLFVAAKAFAAGVILATGFVHMLPDGYSNLTNPCLPEYPWSDFPFSGLFAMASALLTLLADFVGTQVYERKQKARVGPAQTVTVPGEALAAAEGAKVFGEEDGGGMHIVGIRAHSAHHSHSHSQETKGCAGSQNDDYVPLARSVDEEEGEGHFGHIHSHAHGGNDDGEEDGASRHVVVSQVLELGIVSHSDNRTLIRGIPQHMHNPATNSGAVLPPILRGLRSRRLHFPGPIQDAVHRHHGLLLHPNNPGRDRHRHRRSLLLQRGQRPRPNN